MMWFVKLILLCAILNLSWADEEEVLLETSLGTLKGLKKTTVFHGMPMYSFQGIPYAQPNIGPNKFRSPLPVESWTGVKDATKLGDTCIFFCMVRQGHFGDDDCLFLNVYTPVLDKNAKKAVMVFFHPGGFNGGSGDDDLFGGDFLVERDVVVVTMNFRLGPVGFLNTGDVNAPGNAGMKDQVMALKWIQDNIMNFGGCPKKVTLFGHSSGAAAVQYHMLSPMSKDLFSGAIMQSGSAVPSWAISYTPQQDTMKLAEKLGIEAYNNAELVQQLASKPTRDLVTAAGEISKTMNFLGGEMNLFRPSVEADFGQEVFLPGDPLELIKSGKINDVPLMAGLTSEESALFTPMVLPMASNFENNFELFLPVGLNITDEGQKKQIGNMLKEFYFKGKPVNADTSMELTNLLTDSFFMYGIALSTRIMNERMTSPVYQYLFTFKQPMGFMKSLFKLENEPGVMHGDELPYVFYAKFYDNKPKSGSPVEQKTNEMIEMWTNFAKEKNPSVSMDVAKVMWKPMDKDLNYLEIGNELTMKKSLMKDRVDFWASVYKNVLGDYAKFFN